MAYLRLRNVDPEVGMTYGGGFVSVFGYGFLNSTGLNCSFEWIGASIPHSTHGL